jgi:hypothetical protein
MAAAAPAAADQERQRRPRENSANEGQSARTQEPARQRERAVPRAAEARRQEQSRADQQVRRDEQIRRDEQVRRDEQSRRDQQIRRDQQVRRDDPIRGDVRRDNGRHNGWVNGRGNRAVPRRYPPRIIRPTIVRVIPYRPYVYRPSYSMGVYYGSGGYYPYGYTPRGYYDPIPGRYYGGVRITGAPRDARVFADGYYVGIVNDFDGIFQHMNLEAGPHHIEIDLGYDGLAFDVYVRPGETTTLRADYYRP